MKKIIFVLTAATFSLVAMNYASADQGGVVPSLRQKIIEECGVGPASPDDVTRYEVCESAVRDGYFPTDH